MPKIECKNLNFSYYDKKGHETSKVFSDLNIVFENGVTSVLLGESGLGKSTLLHILSGLNENYEGLVTFDEEDARNLSIRRRKMSYVTQDVTLYPHLTIFDNIASPLKYVDDISPEEIKIRVRNIAKLLKIEHCLSRKPKHLSYGQQQRVIIAKSFVKDPEVVFLDEPFKGIDEQTKEDLIRFVKEWKKELNATIILVTHDYKEALSLADEVKILEEGSKVVTISKDELKKSKHPMIISLKLASTMEEIK